MASLNSEPPSPTCVNLKEANEIPVEGLNAEFNSVNPEPVACTINPKTGEHAPNLMDVDKKQDKKTYECEECYKIFPTVRTFREHLKCHIKLFTCWICDKTFSVMAQLTSHLTNCNKQQKSMHCNICDKTFDFPALFKQHKLTYHPEDQPCREAFQQRHVFVQNTQTTRTKGKLYTCAVCRKGFTNTLALRQHSLVHEVSNFFCVVCHKELTTTRVDFKIHVQQHILENQPPFKCERCPRFFGKKNHLMSHYRVIHPPKRVIVTNETDSSVAMVASKKKTAILPESEKPITITDKEFCEISELTMKTRTITRRFTCPVCQKGCQSKYSLLEHSYIHEVNNFICVVCHKEFTTSKNGFKIHMQQHCVRDKRGLFTCEHCPRYYGHKRGLISHYRVDHPPTRVFGDKEFCENSEQTERVALVEREPNETDSSIKTLTHNEIIIKKTVQDKTDNILLESEEAASDREFSEENELVSSMKSEPSSPKSPYVNLEDDKFTVEETNVKTEESNAELNNPLPAIIGSKPDMVNDNDPCLVDVYQKLHEKSYECHECHKNYINASYLREHFMKSHCKLLCWICGERFLKVDRLASHIENHVRMYTCKLCDKSFLHLSDYETHVTHCSQNHMNNGNKLFSCGICGKRFITKGHLETHLKTHTEDKLLTRPSKRVVTNETNSSIATVTRRKDKKKKVNEHKDAISAKSPDCTGASIATVAHEKVIQEKLEEQEGLLPESDPLDCNAPINGKEIFEKCELNELMVYSVKSEPSSPESSNSTQKNHSPPPSEPHLVDSNISVNDKAFCKKRQLNKLVVKTGSSKPESCTSSQKNLVTKGNVKKRKVEEHNNVILPESDPDGNGLSIATVAQEKVIQGNLEVQDFLLPESDPVDWNGPVSDKEFCKKSELNELIDPLKSEPSSPESWKSSEKAHSSSFEDFILPELDPGNQNVPVNGKKFCEQSELNELIDPLKSEPSSPESWKSSQKTHSSFFKDFILPELDPVNQNVPINDKEICEKRELNELVTHKMESANREPSSSESCMSNQKTHSSTLSNGNLLHLRRVKAFARPNMANRTVFSGKLVIENKDVVDKQKNHSITNRIPDYKGPFKCKRCPKYFALEDNLRRHCSMDHPQKKVENATDSSIRKRFLIKLKIKKMLEPQKQ